MAKAKKPTKADLSKYGKILGHEGGIMVLKLKKGIFSPAYKKKKKAAAQKPAAKKKTAKRRK